MTYTTWNKAKDLRIWSDTLEARQKLPALVRKLIHATVEKPKLVQFPADEGIQRRGWDGVLEVDHGIGQTTMERMRFITNKTNYQRGHSAAS